MKQYAVRRKDDPDAPERRAVLVGYGNANEVASWVGGRTASEADVSDRRLWRTVVVIDETLRADVDDWIVQVDDGFEVWTASEFIERYGPA